MLAQIHSSALLRRFFPVGLGLWLGLSLAPGRAAARQEIVQRGGQRWILLAPEQRLADLVSAASELFGISIEHDPKALEGATLSVRLAEPLGEEAMWALVNRALLQKGLVSVQPPGSSSLAIVPVAEATKLARLESLDPTELAPTELAGIRPLAWKTRAGFVRVLVPLQRERTEGVVEAITPLLSKAGSASAYKEPAAVLVSDLAPNVEQALEALRVLVPATEVEIEEYQPRHVAATGLVALIERLRQAEKALLREEPKGSLLAVAESGTILVLGTRATVAPILGLFARFDRPEEAQTRQYAPRRFGLAQTEALVRRVLEGTSSQPLRMRMVADELTGTLFVTARPSEHARIEELFERLESTEPGLARTMRAFPVRNRPVEELAELLRGLVEEGAIADLPSSPKESDSPAPAQGVTSPLSGQASAGPPKERPRLVLAVDRPTNRIVALGEPRELERLERLIEELDRRQPQVLVEAFALALTDSEIAELGVELQKTWTREGVRFDLASLFGLGAAPLGSGIVQEPVAGQGLTGAVLDPASFSGLLRAFQTFNRGRALTIPRVLVDNNQTASLDSVVQSPFAATNASQTVATTSFGGTLDAGTQITVVPQIAEGDLLLLDYQVSISRFVGVSADPALPPPREQTKLASLATVPDGYTVIVGGLEIESEARASAQVPLLGSLPGLGFLFQNRTRSLEKSRFFVFLRASVLRGAGFEELRYRSSLELAEAGLDDGWPRLEPRVMR